MTTREEAKKKPWSLLSPSESSLSFTCNTVSWPQELGTLDRVSFFSKSLAPSTVSESDTELRQETMSKECPRAGVKLGGPVCGQATLQAAELPPLEEAGRIAQYWPEDCLLDL